MSEKKAGQQMRMTDADLQIIKQLYADNEAALKVLRKVFLPELTADTPISQNIDLWMTVPVEQMSPEAALVNLKARNLVISHLEQCLLNLKFLAGSKEETVEETKERLQKDSAR